MADAKQLFGIVRHVGNPRIESGAFRFAPASVEFRGRTLITLNEFAKLRPNNGRLMESPTAPWLRGRLQTLFDFQQSPENLDSESWLDGETYADRMMLNTSFVAETFQAGTLIQIPFSCTEQFGDVVIYHGSLPERNTDRNLQLTTQMTNAFVDLLFDSDFVHDYCDYAVMFGFRFEFGVRNGIPYNTFLESQR
jgi:hypothetical protein